MAPISQLGHIWLTYKVRPLYETVSLFLCHLWQKRFWRPNRDLLQFFTPILLSLPFKKLDQVKSKISSGSPENISKLCVILCVGGAKGRIHGPKRPRARPWKSGEWNLLSFQEIMIFLAAAVEAGRVITFTTCVRRRKLLTVSAVVYILRGVDTEKGRDDDEDMRFAWRLLHIFMVAAVCLRSCHPSSSGFFWRRQLLLLSLLNKLCIHFYFGRVRCVSKWAVAGSWPWNMGQTFFKLHREFGSSFLAKLV